MQADSPEQASGKDTLDELVFDPGEPTRTETPAYPIEPGLLPRSRALLPEADDPRLTERLGGYLESRIARNPRDLLSHVQRILLHHEKGEPDACFAALADLFVALGASGRELRENLLRQTADLLTGEQVRLLQRHLDVPLTPDLPLPGIGASSLTHGVSGSTGVIASVHSLDDNPDLLHAAYQSLEAGDEERARRYLEQALDQDPGDATVVMELLALYQRNHLRDAFFSALTRFSSRKLALPELWEKLERHFHAEPEISAKPKPQTSQETKVTDYQLLEQYYVLPTPAGAFYAVSSSEPDPMRKLLLALMQDRVTPKFKLDTLSARLDIEKPALLDLLRQAQTLAWIQGFETPRETPASRIGPRLETLLAPLSAIHKGLLVDWNGFAFARHGIDDETAATLSALAADIAAVENRHAARLKKYLGVASQGWAAVDAYGASRIGAWPLFVGDQRFLLVLQGEPRLNLEQFVELTWILVNRYG